MAEAPRRPPVKIRFRYNTETGAIEQFVIDDQSPESSEAYHDGVAAAVAGCLGRRPQITDAGPRHLLERREPVERRERPRHEEPETPQPVREGEPET